MWFNARFIQLSQRISCDDMSIVQVSQSALSLTICASCFSQLPCSMLRVLNKVMLNLVFISLSKLIYTPVSLKSILVSIKYFGQPKLHMGQPSFNIDSLGLAFYIGVWYSLVSTLVSLNSTLASLKSTRVSLIQHRQIAGSLLYWGLVFISKKFPILGSSVRGLVDVGLAWMSSTSVRLSSGIFIKLLF